MKREIISSIEDKAQRSKKKRVTMAGSWRQLPLTQTSLTFICERLRFPTMAPVQACTIPQLLKGEDVVVQAMTGSGKTLAYIVPIFEALLTKDRIQITTSRKKIHTLILVPTRELGLQVYEILQVYKDFVSSREKLMLNTMRAMGGYETVQDVEQYRTYGCHVLTATPGRLFELLFESSLKGEFYLKELKICILDEADQLLSLGYQTHINLILEKLPKQRQTALFSATQSSEVENLTRCGLRRPVFIDVREGDEPKKMKAEVTTHQLPPPQLSNFYCVLRYHRRFEATVHFLCKHTERQSPRYSRKKYIIYVLTCAGAEWLSCALRVLIPDLNLFLLHGQLPRTRRVRAIKQFSHTSHGLLVCTDVAARGLDLPYVDGVLQYDAPTNPLFFVHRVGRTARMGRQGISMLYLSPDEIEYIHLLRIQDISITMTTLLGDLSQENTEVPHSVFTFAAAAMKKADRLRQKKKKKALATRCENTLMPTSEVYQCHEIDVLRRAVGQAFRGSDCVIFQSCFSCSICVYL